MCISWWTVAISGQLLSSYIYCVQITTLVNAKEKPIRSERTLAALVRVGQAVNLAIERFVSVGEAIARDNADIQREMSDACRDARAAGLCYNLLFVCHHCLFVSDASYNIDNSQH